MPETKSPRSDLKWELRPSPTMGMQDLLRKEAEDEPRNTSFRAVYLTTLLEATANLETRSQSEKTYAAVLDTVKNLLVKRGQDLGQWPGFGSAQRTFVGTVDEIAQNQVVITGDRGRGREAFRGRKVFSGDAQSELLPLAIAERTAQKHEPVARSPSAPSPHEEMQFSEVCLDTSAEDIVVQILELDRERDWHHLRKLVVLAEDVEFDAQACQRLWPRLLDVAMAYRDSVDPMDEPVVWAAIRTGASMLRPQEAHRLLPFLDPGHEIETSLVALKMLGRVFEAYPPEDVDQHVDLASEIGKVVGSLMNRYAAAIAQSAAMAQLAIYALVAIGSSESIGVVQAVRELGLPWFTQRTIRKLSELQDRWQRLSETPGEPPLRLLIGALGELRRCAVAPVL